MKAPFPIRDSVERFLPADDPVLEEVLIWTINRDSLDMRRLLEWLPQAQTVRERRVLLERVELLSKELGQAVDKLAILQSG